MGNCDIDFFVFRHRFRITSLKFLKIQLNLKCCQKISKHMKAKAQNYEIEQNCDLLSQDRMFATDCHHHPSLITQKFQF
jgi:hypothetical protein